MNHELDKTTIGWWGPRLNKMFDRMEQEVKEYSKLEKYWDGYSAEKIDAAVISTTLDSLSIIKKFFEDNAGLLNNRSFEASPCPLSGGGIVIELNYDREFHIDIDICKEKDGIELSVFAGPKFRYLLDGTKTIAGTRYDWNGFTMVWPEDMVTGKITDLRKWLEWFFFEKTWKFSPSAYKERLPALESNLAHQRKAEDDRTKIIKSLEEELARVKEALREEEEEE